MADDMMAKMKSFYAPKVSFSMMPQSKTLSEHQHFCKMEDATVDEMFAESFKQFGGFKNEKISNAHNAVDFKSGGKVIITLGSSTVGLVDSSGAVISATKEGHFPFVNTYTFDDDGKIAALDMMFDTLLVENMKKRAAEHEAATAKAGA